MLNLNINLKKRLENKTFWVGIISTVILLLSKYNIDLTQYIGSDWQDRLNIIFTLLAMLGVTVDTSTAGINDNVTTTDVTDSTIQVATESTNTSVADSSNSTTTTSSASSKIVVDNPDNVQVINATVNATSAVAPN